MKRTKETTRWVVVLSVVVVLAMAAPAAMAHSGKAAAPAHAAKLFEATASDAPSSVAVLRSSPVGPALPSLRAAAPSPVMFYEGFEGTLSSWQVQGSPTWGITTYRFAAGQASAYCAQSAIPAPGPYADDMAAWLKAGPFDLSQVTAATLSYKLYLKSEEDIDDLACYVSLDGINWYGWSTTGDTQGWVDKVRNLASVITIGSVCGKSQVWIGFKFESDDSFGDEGAYIDEVKLTDQTPPSVTAINPASGPAGSTATLTGAGLSGTTAVSFNGVAAPFTVVSATQISVTVPAGATSGLITVTTPYGVRQSTTSFTVTVPPKVTGLTPSQGRVGASVIVGGTALDGATKVTFGGVAAAYRIDSATSITAVVPTGAKTGVVEVTTPGGVATSATSFVVLVKPQLLRVSPTAARHGATVTLTGKDFGSARGTGCVKFGVVKCTKFVSWSATRIKCVVPGKAKVGRLKVTVVSAGGTSAARTFTVKR
jgi:hypothetical protein